MSELGSRIGDYEVWGRIGEGGMSEVWLAKHTVLRTPVVIKTLRTALPPEEGDPGAERMLHEARVMARVTSPRVVRAVDAGVHDAVPYLVQEYVDGMDLQELDRRRRQALGVGLPLWFCCQAMAETCEALRAAHQAGVIHRDVKPSNLFATPDLGTRLGDFGVAVMGAERGPAPVSGTPRFMAPEQLRGDEVGRFTDVYGAGATAFDLRYGRTPFASVGEVLDERTEAQFPPPRSPEEAYFQHLLRGMLGKNPARRPHDLSEPLRHFRVLARALCGDGAHTPFTSLTKTVLCLGDCQIAFARSDIADAEADGIVSSANYEMNMRTGVAKALRVRGGDAIEQDAMSGGERPLGTCIATQAGKLHARHVLHAVSAWNEASCIGRATYRALLLADELGLRSLAFAALGTGVARVSMETCANAMMSTLRWHLSLGGTRLRRITVHILDEDKLAVFREVAEDALRGDQRALHTVDLGLPEEEGEVRGDSATFIDTSRKDAK